tara:strand:+ start:80 stop:1528 length:1449 start_codon:yes stop_codon:yes gene_type:complete
MLKSGDSAGFSYLFFNDASAENARITGAGDTLYLGAGASATNVATFAPGAAVIYGDLIVTDAGTTSATISATGTGGANQAVMRFYNEGTFKGQIGYREASDDFEIWSQNGSLVTMTMDVSNNVSIPNGALAVTGNLANNGTFISNGGTALTTAVVINTPSSVLCPTLTMTRNGGGTTTNDLYRGANSGGTVFNVDSSGGIYGTFVASSGNMRVDGQLTVNGAASVPTSGQGKYAASGTHGAQILGYGSTNDVVLGRRDGGIALRVPANTVNVVIAGSLSKGSGSFRIDHPLKPETHELVHSFTESPQADLLYSGTSDLVDGAAEINLDEFHSMTEGTFVALNRNIRVFTTNESDWEPIKGSVTGNILSISCQDTSCSDKVSWMVIGERHDDHMMSTEWTDEQGRVIVEPLKPEEPAQVQRTISVPVMLDGEQVTALETVDVPESIEVIDGVAVLTAATTEEVIKPQFEDIGVVDVDGNPVYE